MALGEKVKNLGKGLVQGVKATALAVAAAGMLAYGAYAFSDTERQREMKDFALLPMREAAYYFASTSRGFSTMEPHTILAKIIQNEASKNYCGFHFNETKDCQSGGILAMYLGLEPVTFPHSLYKPTSLTKFQDVPLYSIAKHIVINPFSAEEAWNTETLQKLQALNEGEILRQREKRIAYLVAVYVDLGHYTISFGRDKRGIYLSIFDVWDFEYGNESRLDFLQRIPPRLMQLVGNPIGIYDRFYLDEEEIKKELERREGLEKSSTSFAEATSNQQHRQEARN